MAGRGQKLLIAAGLVLAVTAILYVMRLNERMDREQARSVALSESSQCSTRCQQNYSQWQRRCSTYEYDGTRDWCRQQARNSRSSCLARCS